MTPKDFQKYIDSYDWQGLAKAYHDSEVSLGAKEWEEIFEYMKEKGFEEGRGAYIGVSAWRNIGEKFKYFEYFGY